MTELIATNAGDDLGVSLYERVPFQVSAVQVTAENIEQVAEWCDGKVLHKKATQTRPATRYVRVPVKRPKAQPHRLTIAYPGDWVLYNGKGYKVYLPEVFTENFRAV